MLLNYNKKQNIILNIKKKINQSLSIILLNFINITSNEINIIRKDISLNEICMIMARNTLFKIAFKDTKFNCLIKYFNGPTIVIFSINSYSLASKVFYPYKQKYKGKINIKAISVDGNLISLDLNKKLSFLYSLKLAIMYFIFLIKNIFIFKIFRVLRLVINKKNI